VNINAATFMWFPVDLFMGFSVTLDIHMTHNDLSRCEGAISCKNRALDLR
jgi:hypothetical protein